MGSNRLRGCDPRGAHGQAWIASTKSGDELRALRRLQREQDPKSPFVFTCERGAPFTTAGLEAAGFGFKAHPHMLRCMPVGLPSLTGAMTHGHSTRNLATGIISTQCATPNYRRIGSRTSGASWATLSTPARELIAKQKRRQAEQECAR